MSTRTKVLLSLGAFALAQAAPAAIDGGFGGINALLTASAWADGGEGGEGGESGEAHSHGEGSEGSEGGEGGADLGVDDVAYLTRLALIEGHLHVGIELYRAGDKTFAASHLKHPRDEVYASLVPAFETRKAVGFATELDALSAAVGSGAPAAEVDSAYSRLLGQITAARAGINIAPKTALLVASKLVREAAEEYAVGVKDGKVVNVHEYQDSLGFVMAADRLIKSGAASPPGAEAAAELAKLAPAWPNLVPPDILNYDLSLMHGAAAKLELLAQDAK